MPLPGTRCARSRTRQFGRVADSSFTKVFVFLVVSPERISDRSRDDVSEYNAKPHRAGCSTSTEKNARKDVTRSQNMERAGFSFTQYDQHVVEDRRTRCKRPATTRPHSNTTTKTPSPSSRMTYSALPSGCGSTCYEWHTCYVLRYESRSMQYVCVISEKFSEVGFVEPFSFRARFLSDFNKEDRANSQSGHMWFWRTPLQVILFAASVLLLLRHEAA